MKNFSAPKLLRLALAGSHITNCPHVNDKSPGYECLCWKNELRKWDVRAKLSSANRTRKPKEQKCHLMGHTCSGKLSPKSGQTRKASVDVTCVTCKQCLKFANTPVKTPKAPKISKNQKKTNGLSAGSSMTVAA